MMYNHVLFERTVAAGLLAVFLAGCGQGGLDRRVVTGRVTFAGQPVEIGEIQFYPEGETQGPQTGSQIENGDYRLDARGGVPVGTHKVRIIGYMNTGRTLTPQQRAMLPPDMQDANVGQFVQYIPAKYNRQTELTVSVESGSGTMTHDFELKP